MRLPALLLSVALLGSAGCRPYAAPGPDVVAHLGDREIRLDAFSSYLKANLGEPLAQLPPAVHSALLDQFLDEQCLVELARSRGLATPTTPPRKALESLLEAALDTEPAEDATRAYYEQHEEEFHRPERVRLRQILVEERATAAEAFAELERGTEFTEVARHYSIEPRAPQGGDQGTFAREDLPAAFAEAIFQLAPGEVSDIIVADYGFHIFQVVERHPEELVPYTEAAPEIRQRLERERTETSRARLLALARQRCNVTVHTLNLPFAYHGAYDQ